MSSLLYTLSLHDALPISKPLCPSHQRVGVKQSVVSISSSRDWPRFTGWIMLVRSVGAGIALLAAIQAEFRFRSEEHTSELQSRRELVCRLLLEKKKSQKE